MKKYNDERIEAQKLKTICLCGSTFRKVDTNRHEKTDKHRNYIANQPIDG